MRKLTLIYQTDLDEFKFCCNNLDKKIKEKKIIYIPYFREFGILKNPVAKGEMTVFEDIKVCPFCTKKFPNSLREKWFLTLEKLGFDDPWDQKIPEEFKSDKWWKKI